MTLPLLPYQYEGATFLAGRRRAGLFDDMGLGKSAQAVVAMDANGARRSIIVCPASVRAVWRGEIRKFSTVDHRIVSDPIDWTRDGQPGVLILSYEAAATYSVKLQGDLFDLIVFDESQYLKTKGTNRTTRMLGWDCDGRHGLANWAGKAWFLSGTPAPNDPADIWPFLRFTHATELSRQTFIDRYFKTKKRSYSDSHRCRSEMLAELRHTIRSVSLRRDKSQAGILLPPVWLTTQTVDGDTHEIRELLRTYPDLEKAIVEAVEQGGLSFLNAQHIATLRRLVGEAKAPALVELVDEELNNGLDKVVIFGEHRKALEILRTGLSRRGHRVVHIDGSTGERDRVRAVEEFQRNPDVRVFVGNLIAAGTGLTLTASANVIMLESAWTPAVNAQALMRVHRIGQDRNVRATFITLANSIDEFVNETVARKTGELAKMGFVHQLAA